MLLLPLLLLFFCLFIIQIATLLGWIRWVSSTSHVLGFPSWVLECFQLFKTIDGSKVTSLCMTEHPALIPVWGLVRRGGVKGSQTQPVPESNLSPHPTPRTAEASRKKKENRRKWKRYLLIGLATLGGGTVIGKMRWWPWPGQHGVRDDARLGARVGSAGGSAGSPPQLACA